MTSKHPALRDRLRVENGFYLILVGTQTRYWDVPELSNPDTMPGCSMSSGLAARGVKGFCFSLVLIPPKAALQTFAHEFAHALDHEMERLSPGFFSRVRAAYDNAKAEGLWPPSVIRGIWYEYWAEGVEIWFYEIGAGRMFETRAEFMAHDPLLGGILSEWFPAVSLRRGT